MYNLSTWEVLLPSVKEIELEFCVLKLPFFMNVYKWNRTPSKWKQKEKQAGTKEM